MTNYFDGTPEAAILRACVLWTREEGCPECGKAFYLGTLNNQPYRFACCECGAGDEIKE